MLSDPAGLVKGGEAAKRAGTADAAERLADLVLSVARYTDNKPSEDDPIVYNRQ